MRKLLLLGALVLALSGCSLTNPFAKQEEVTFELQGQIDTIVQATLRALTPSPTATLPPPTLTPAGTTGPTATLAPSHTPTASPTSLPIRFTLDPPRYMDQHNAWNYCGPANLAMALAYWGWQGDRYTTGDWLRGGRDRIDDKNVMPYEMQMFVEEETDLAFLWRFGGDIDLLKRLIVGGFPVMVEKSFYLEGIGWMGHFLLLTGYDDAEGTFIPQDSYVGADTPIEYLSLIQEWRSFNYTFLIAYPHDHADALYTLLGPWLDDDWDDRRALETARHEIETLEGRDLFFAYFNMGTSHTYLYEYYDAALAFDIAWPINDALPWETRAWRMIWYNTSPYRAYYYVGRYQQIDTIATDMLNWMEDNDRHGAILEESYYWRGMAREMMGDLEGAIADLRESVRLNPNFRAGWEQLNRLGAAP